MGQGLTICVYCLLDSNFNACACAKSASEPGYSGSASLNAQAMKEFIFRTRVILMLSSNGI